MMDQILLNRAQNFKSSNVNIQKYREERSLMLRKEKIFENIMSKRIANMKNRESDEWMIDEINYGDKSEREKKNSLEINTLQSDSIKIPENELEYFTKIKDKFQKLGILKNYLIKGQSNGYNYANFAIHHIKLFFMKNLQNEGLKKALIEDELCILILNEFLVTKDIPAMCDLGLILTQITYYSQSGCELFLDQNTLKQLIDMISIDNKKIKENIIIILGNILVQNKNFIINNTDYLICLKRMLEDKEIFSEQKEDSDLRKIILWNLIIIINGMSSEEQTHFEFLVPISKTYFLCKKNLKFIKKYDKSQEEINQILQILSDLSNNDDIIESMIKNHLIDDLVHILKYVNIAYGKDYEKYEAGDLIILTPTNFLLVIKIINNIFCGSDESLLQNNVLSIELIEILENLLLRYRLFQKPDKKVVNEIIWVLSNIAAGPSKHIILLMATEIPKYLFRFYGNKDEQVLVEILIFFEQALMKGNKPITVEILKLNFIKFIFDSIKSYDNHQIIKTCLNLITILIQFSKEIYCLPEESSLNSIRFEFMKHSIVTRLEQLAIHNNKDIAKFSQKLLEEVECMINEHTMMN